MIGKSKAGIVIASTIAVLAFGGAEFIGSGVYNIGADDHHTKIVLTLIEQLRDHSIESRSRRIEAHFVADPARIANGAQNYAALCVGCHLAPGVTKSDIRPGLYPHPPNLAQEEMQPAQRAFWVIKHGIKMSAMPAWGTTLDDEAIWDIVAFIRKMPEMTPDSYRRLSQNRSGLRRMVHSAVIRFGIEFAMHPQVGAGKISLLEAIRTTGSLSQAARDLGVSYRHAWLLIDSLKFTFREPVTLATRGGRGGGGVALTRFGESLVVTYRALEREISEVAARRLRRITPMIERGRGSVAVRHPLTIKRK